MTTPQQDAAALGLAPDATPEQVRQAATALVTHLENAPAELSGWAAMQRSLAERAIAGVDGTTVSPEAAALAADFDALGLGDQLPASVAPQTAAVKAPPRKWVRPLALVAAGAAVVLGVFFMSPKPDTATDQAQQQAAASQMAAPSPRPIDPEMVKVLEGKVKADPKDTTSMKALGQIYSEAQQYDKAASWMQRITVADPTDLDGWMGLGAAQFYAKDLTGAEKSWKQAVALNPKYADAHYNLGFLYLSLGDQPKAKAAWQKVVELAPDSTEAKTVQSHLAAWTASTAAPSTSGSPAPSPSATASR